MMSADSCTLVPIFGGHMGLVLRAMAASALIATVCVMPVSAQTGFANMIDHVHLAAPDPIKAVEWYRKKLAGQPTTEGTDRLMFRPDARHFSKEREANAQRGQRCRPHRLFGQRRRCGHEGDGSGRC